MSIKRIVHSSSVISFFTFLSRILGFIRDIVIARLFGIYVYAQAFVVAFKIPNLFRDLLAEGSSNAAFVPVFSQYKIKESPDKFWELVNIVLRFILFILITVTLLGIFFSPWIVRLIAPGFIYEPYKLITTIRLNRIIFPYILLISLASYATAVLNSLGHFSIPAFAPCLLNISLILFTLIFGEGIKGLALGVLVGGVLQLAVQIPVLYKKGFRLIRPRTLRHPELGTIKRLLLPRIFSTCIYQLNNFVDSIFGSLGMIVGEGGVAILYFSYRLIQFPLGIFSNALFQAILPVFSVEALEPAFERLKKTLSWGLGAVFFVMVPCSIGFMILAKPIISTLFGEGRFDLKAVELTSGALFFYSMGLSFYGANKILQACFFSLKDTLTPTKVAGLALILNIILNTILMFPLRIMGLAFATSLSGIITFFILLSLLIKKIGGFHLKELGIYFLRIIFAGLGMGLVCYGLNGVINLSGFALAKYINLGLVIILGLFSYIFFCFIFGVLRLKDIYSRRQFSKELPFNINES
ncbi:MAG: murein biosynthesis integral membrane protein MurJ [Candidatus Omnitrophica bacterium]|nr:murein biosynthesis integral membrane protein MurJ [Candidatus Omnitrophota bacterium]